MTSRPLATSLPPTNPGTAAPVRMPRTAGKGKNTPRHQALVNIGTRRRIGRMGGAARVMPEPTAHLPKSLPAYNAHDSG